MLALLVISRNANIILFYFYDQGVPVASVITDWICTLS